MSGRGGPGPRERLGDYAALLAWGRKAALLSEAEASALAATAAAEPAAADVLAERARALREALVRLFLAAIEGSPPEAEPLAILNRELTEAPPRRRLDWSEGGFAWRSETGQVTALAQPLWPLLWSAAELLAGGEIDRIKICAGDDCGWLFYDASRNGTRRWCSMADCGNVAKARRHYARRRSANR